MAPGDLMPMLEMQARNMQGLVAAQARRKNLSHHRPRENRPSSAKRKRKRVAADLCFAGCVTVARTSRVRDVLRIAALKEKAAPQVERLAGLLLLLCCARASLKSDLLA